MTMVKRDGVPGRPWDRPLTGTLDRLLVQSELLRDNPLGDPDTRPLYVYCSPGVDGGHPVSVVYWLQGFLGQVDMHTSRSALEPTFVERLDEMFARGVCPPAIGVMGGAGPSR